MTEKKCKHICKYCIHFDADDETCNYFYKDVHNCIIDKTERIYDKCIKHNKGGCCGKYEVDEDKILRKKILKSIEKYQTYRYSKYYGETDLTDLLSDKYIEINNKFNTWKAEMAKTEPHGPFKDY